MNPEEWVEAYGDALYRYALSRHVDPMSAQDLVQETFLAALKNQDRFNGKSSPQTWLIGILRNKMLDRIRKESRLQSSADMEQTLAVAENELFDASGRWRTGPQAWETDPHVVLERKEFRDVLARCLGHLPVSLRTAFMLREMDGLDAEEICKHLDITATNLWVMLHRARLKLRSCLGMNWFERKGGAL